MTAYAVGVAMNNFLPANIGTFATLVMFVAIIPGSTFPGSIAAYIVQKIFFTIAGTFVYLYLFLSVPGSFDVSLGQADENAVTTILIALGIVVGLVIVGRIFWRQVKKLWAKAKQGGVILSRPKEYLLHAFLPSLLSWLCKLAVIGIFLAAFTIPVTFESIMWVTGSGSLANVVSVTPGAVGITQATNALALDTCCDVAKSTAVDYSTAQQLITTAWNVLLAVVLVVSVFGWKGGKQLVTASYADAKGKVAEQKTQRAEKKAAKRAERKESGRGRLHRGRRRRGRGGCAAAAPEEENTMTSGPEQSYGQSMTWQPERPRWRLFPLVVSWLGTGVALMVAAAVLPGVDIASFWGALVVAVIVAALNAVIPPLLAALRLPLTLVLGFLLVLIADALILQLAARVSDDVLTVDNFGWALLASLVVAAVSVVIAVILGTDDETPIRIAQRIARRQGIIASTDVPGIVYLEIDGLALPVLRRAMRDGNAPTMARWLANDSHKLTEWETDLSSQTGASQAGILLGSNEDISAFRWVEKETATLMTCSAPPDCAEIERRTPPASACSSTAAPAAGTCSPARRTT